MKPTKHSAQLSRGAFCRGDPDFQKTWDDFLKNGLPNHKDERFKYTNFTFLENAHFKEVSEVSNHDCRDLSDIIHSYRSANEACIMLVFVNGYFVKALSDMEKLSHPVKVCGLQEALSTEVELIQPFFDQDLRSGHWVSEASGRVPLSDGCREDRKPSGRNEGLGRFFTLNQALNTDIQKYPFAHLNSSLCKDGLLIYVPEHYELTAPIYLLSLATTKDADPFITNPHHLIMLNPHSKLTLIEEYVSLSDEAYMMNVVMTTLVKEEAKFTHYKIQQEGKAAVHMAHHFIHQKKDSSVNLMNFSFGGRFSRDEVAIHLEEGGATCHTYGFYHLREKNQYIDHHVDIDHKAPYSTSEMHYKGIIAEASRAVFNGRLHVHPNAQKVVAHQENHHLLLNDGAESYAKPELTIDADDVKCKHGATTGEMDEEALFYLCSRGIAKEEAMEMLLQGFAASIIDRILEPAVKSRVESLRVKR